MSDRRAQGTDRRSTDSLSHHTHGNEGGWLTLVHGGLVDSRTWKRLVPDLEPYCRVLAYDLRGYGRSDRSHPSQTISDHADDVLALWDRLGIADGILLGFSMGGQVAQEVALRAPERVTGLILVSTAGRLDEHGRAALQERAAAIEAGALEGEARVHTRRAFSPGFVESQPEVIERYMETITGNDPRVLTQTLINVATFDRLDDLGQIQCPTLILSGELDSGMPPAYAEQMADRIPDSTAVVVPGVGHTMHIESPSTFSHIVADFVASTFGWVGDRHAVKAADG